ncbi:glycosyltransferase [Alteromonas macleodii]|uniref:glycosyltransferase n=1 Tax=Alteromonas macleodii TaxID=28108 RepID=UPI00365A162B
MLELKKDNFWELMSKVRNYFSKLDYIAASDVIEEIESSQSLEEEGRIELVNKTKALIERNILRLNSEQVTSGQGIVYSFVTSVFNRFWQLKQTLPTNLETLRNFENAELVVVDFGGEDSSDIQNFIDKNFSFDLLTGKLKYFRIKKAWAKFHMASAKNAAARLSIGEYIISLDADNFVNKSDVEHIINALDGESSIVHQTTGPAPMLHKDWEKYQLFQQNTYHNENLTWDGSCGRIASSRSIFEKINGYNENFIGMGMDDIDFLIRSVKSGGQYKHISLSRNVDTIFIDNGSAATEHEHSDNRSNWELMEKALARSEIKASYETQVPTSKFSRYIPEAIRRTGSVDVTLFSSIFRADEYVTRFENDISDILSGSTSPVIILMDVVGSHDEKTSRRLATLADKHPSVYYLPVFKDPGLYDCWNVAIRNIRSKYIANLNVDDIRGRQWLDTCVRALESDICDVVSPVTVPFSDSKINSYDDFLARKLNGEHFEKWFDVKVSYNYFENVVNYEKLNAGYYDHSNMFQTNSDKVLRSYCIPNASSVWRRKIHEDVGYFEEEKYGAYTDLALWMNASFTGSIFKQVNYSALFFISESQAHARQESNYNTLLELADKYGDAEYKLLALSNKFDLSLNEGSYGDHHLLGWNWVRDNVNQMLTHNEHGVYLDLFIERTFFWNKDDPDRTFVFRKPWVAFVHTTPHKSNSYDLEAQNLDALLAEPRFIESLKHCRGLIVLSQENASYLRLALKKLGYPKVKVLTTFHPNIPITSSTEERALSGKVYHIGWHLRSFSDFVKLDIPKENKVLLIPGNLDRDYFINDVVNKELSENNLGTIDDYVSEMYTADNDEYQDILKNQVVFNSYIQPAGSNLISECISAGACLVINRHTGFEGYLGADYPLFYDDLLQARENIKRIVNEPTQRNSVIRHLKERDDRLSISSFKGELVRILKVLIKNS